MEIEDKLSRQYKKETGHAIFNFNGNLNYSYVIWLAKKIECLQSQVTKVKEGRDSLKMQIEDSQVNCDLCQSQKESNK